MIHFMLTSVYGVGYRSTLFSSMPPSFFFLTFHMCLIVSFENQIRSVAQSCLTLCDPINYGTPGLPVHHQLPEFTQTHVHRVSDAIHHLILCRPLLLLLLLPPIPPNIRVWALIQYDVLMKKRQDWDTDMQGG